jgi:hypothetical protein
MQESTKNEFRALALLGYVVVLLFGGSFVVASLRKGTTSIPLVVLEILGIALLVGYLVRQRSSTWRTRRDVGRTFKLEEKVRTGAPHEAEAAIRSLAQSGDPLASTSLNILVADESLLWSLRAKVAAAIGEASNPTGIQALREVFDANTITFQRMVDDHSRGPYLRKHAEEDDKAEVGAFLAPLAKLATQCGDQKAITFVESVRAQCQRLMDQEEVGRRRRQKESGY